MPQHKPLDITIRTNVGSWRERFYFDSDKPANKIGQEIKRIVDRRTKSLGPGHVKKTRQSAFKYRLEMGVPKHPGKSHARRKKGARRGK